MPEPPKGGTSAAEGDRGERRAPPAWAARLLRLCLRAWPLERRRREGDALLATAEALVGDAFALGTRTGAVTALSEAAALLAAGTGLRWGRLRAVVAAAAAGIAGDVRFALRTLRRSPGFTAVAVVTLALGLGANAAVFGLVDRVLLRPPPYTAPEELVFVWNRLPGGDERIPVAGPDAAVLEQRSRTLAAVAFATRGVDGAVATATGAEHVRIAAVTPDLFRVLGVRPALGRDFGDDEADDGAGTAGDAGAGAATAVLLSDGVWRRLFGADPGIVGGAIRMNGFPVTVAGVMPRGFRIAAPPDAGVRTDVDVWLPLEVPLTAFHRDDDRLLDQDSDNSGVVIARLAAGASLEAARSDAERIAAALRDEIPAYEAARLGFTVRRVHEDATRHARGVLGALSAGVAAVLLIACLNLSALLVARGLARAREWSVRSALGAGRGRLARQVAVEAAVLAAAGTMAALAVAAFAAGGLDRVIPTALAEPHVTPDGGGEMGMVPALGAAVAVLLGIVAAFQALRASTRMASGLGGRTEGGGAIRSRRALVITQVALSVVLVLGAGLLLRTVVGLRDVRPGFETADALTFRTSLRLPERYRSPADRALLMRRIEEAVASHPGVRAVGLSGALPLSGDRWTQPYGLPGQAPSEWQANRADFRVVTSGWFDALGARVIEGRGFTPAEDLDEDERVVVIDERLARRIAPGGSAVGLTIGVPLDGAPVEARVVGVVEHVRHASLETDGRETVYVPYRQEASREVAFVVRAEADPLALAPAVRAAVRSLDPDLPVYDVRTLEDYVAEALGPRTFALALLAGFAVLGLLCSAVGLYGVVAFDVRRGTRDLGLRMAVGASPGRVLASILTQGLRLAAWGALAGVLLGGAAVRGLRSLVHGVGLADPLTWAAALAVVGAVTLAACALPALRASRLDPVEALRAD